MNYYQKKQFVAEVNNGGEIVGKIEKWQAHKNAVLHRGYTCILIFNNQLILQHRKHPVFDKVYDLSFSSHQIYKNGTLQDNEDAIYEGLKREWNLGKKDLKSGLNFLNKIYYKAKDPKSDYTEHEIDYIYKVELNTLPSPNLDFAYNFLLVPKLKISNLKFKISLAPWAKKMLSEKLI